jgi:selenocysteine-specific elongation factor
VTVLDVAPPGLSRRGAAAARATELTTMDGTPSSSSELRRRGLIRRADLVAMGVPPSDPPVAGDWFADPTYWAALAGKLAAEVERHRADHPLEPGAPVEALRHRLGLPDRALVEALVKPPLTVRGGRVSAGSPGVPDFLVRAVDKAFEGLRPFAAPETYDLGLDSRQLAAAVRAGLLVQLAPNVVLRPGAPAEAARLLAALPQPFTISEARKALDTTRRVAVPLLELLDRSKLTRRHPDDRRTTIAAIDT